MKQPDGIPKKRTRQKIPKPMWIGYLPEDDPCHQQVFQIFNNAGFEVQKLGINKDLSMATFWLKQGKYPPFKNQKQAHEAIFRLLRAGIKVKRDDVAFWLDTVSMGAFTPPQHKVPGY